MTNKEYYKEQILEIACNGDSIAYDKKNNELVPCSNITCSDCLFRNDNDGNCYDIVKAWCEKEYVEHYVDWSTVEVDTKIYVKDYADDKWLPRYFSKYENGKVFTFTNGCTSWSAERSVEWRYAKLAE